RPAGCLWRGLRRVLRHRPRRNGLHRRGARASRVRGRAGRGGRGMSAPREKPGPIRLHRELAAIWDTPSGWGRLSAVNHTVLGKRFIVAALVFFAIGGLLAMLIRVQLAT